jgi:hypothetical protein
VTDEQLVDALVKAVDDYASAAAHGNADVSYRERVAAARAAVLARFAELRDEIEMWMGEDT